MGNKRKEIRTALAALLNGSTSAGDRVFPSRVHPTYRLTYPAVFVFATEEKSTTVQLVPRMYERTLSLKIQVVTAGVTSDSEDEIDTVMGQIEDLVDPVRQLTSDVTITEYVGAQIDLFSEGSSDFASGILEYEAKYYTEVEYATPVYAATVNIDGNTIELE